MVESLGRLGGGLEASSHPLPELIDRVDVHEDLLHLGGREPTTSERERVMSRKGSYNV